MAQTTPTKKEIYFNFGPNESYFVRFGSQHRRSQETFPKTAGKLIDTADGSRKFDCVAWNDQGFFLCTNSKHHCNKSVAENAPSEFAPWMKERQLSPLRAALSNTAGSWCAWMLHGDHLMGPYAPQGMRQAAANAEKASTSIRVASIGTHGTWLLIWEDGTMASELKDQYPGLQAELRGLGGFDVADISWVALNPFRVDDYFLYVDRKKMAAFQVSAAFGEDLKSVLEAQGIDTRKMVLRKQDVVRLPPSIPRLFKKADLVGIAERNTEIDLDALTNFAVTTVKNIAAVGSALAGMAACNVM